MISSKDATAASIAPGSRWPDDSTQSAPSRLDLSLHLCEDAIGVGPSGTRRVGRAGSQHRSQPTRYRRRRRRRSSRRCRAAVPRDPWRDLGSGPCPPSRSRGRSGRHAPHERAVDARRGGDDPRAAPPGRVEAQRAALAVAHHRARLRGDQGAGGDVPLPHRGERERGRRSGPRPPGRAGARARGGRGAPPAGGPRASARAPAPRGSPGRARPPAQGGPRGGSARRRAARPRPPPRRRSRPARACASPRPPGGRPRPARATGPSSARPRGRRACRRSDPRRILGGRRGGRGRRAPPRRASHGRGARPSAARAGRRPRRGRPPTPGPARRACRARLDRGESAPWQSRRPRARRRAAARGRPPHSPASVSPSTRSEGTTRPRWARASFAGRSAASISRRLPATVHSFTG